ncbi:ROK family protein [Meiothermus ruber]|uniref:ROK family protein n=1 Tax=Meiothermus ruber (strain ATCC 35948 / DSM 1279 / VKM B-1258 / 21) TaxID=504728 RepID=D3PMU5_MEIRD|nr:ROK family protein [Meiothermus ruber]ADD27270.1 ROK family protein [Meiothermus ruber DSM 1279]AGK03722.1 ROK family protein [Meiothermus ruber DSM 1279]MCL6530048.1 ROK family protein [Meiothermus ruber]GAO74195.1 ROK family protein [Meiothermus ruber H328]
MSVVGIDLGGTKIMAGVFSEGVIKTKVTVPTPEEGGQAVIEAMAQAAKAAIEASGVAVQAIGLGTPGPLDFKRGRIKFAPNIANFTDFPIVERLEQATGYKVYMENDANAAALAEHKLGAAQGAESTLYMTVSTGVGGGFVWGNKVLRGVNGQGGEIGHITMQPGGPSCGCGLDGCLEALATGPAMERMALASFKREMNTRELFALFQQGDPRASRIVLQAASWVGIALASLVKCYDPEVVVLGGGVALNAGPAYLEEVQRSYQRYMENWITPPLHLAKLGSEAGLLGAALTAAIEVGEL